MRFAAAVATVCCGWVGAACDLSISGLAEVPGEPPVVIDVDSEAGDDATTDIVVLPGLDAAMDEAAMAPMDAALCDGSDLCKRMIQQLCTVIATCFPGKSQKDCERCYDPNKKCELYSGQLACSSDYSMCMQDLSVLKCIDFQKAEWPDSCVRVWQELGVKLKPTNCLL